MSDFITQQKLYEIYNEPANENKSKRFNPYIYSSGEFEVKEDDFFYTSKVSGYLPKENTYGKRISEVKKEKSDMFKIHYRYVYHENQVSPNDDWCILIHGVPCNSTQKVTTMHNLAPFMHCFAIDLLGKGKSSKPLDLPDWSWEMHATYLNLFVKYIKKTYGLKNGPHIAGDDWGGGLSIVYASSYEEISSLTVIDPIIFDGHPVHEIQSIAMITQQPWEYFDARPLAFAQTVQQILKTMVFNSERLNTFTEYGFLFPYIDTQRNSGRDANESQVNDWNIYVLAQMASALNPEQLFPLHDRGKGVDFENINVDVNIIWGKEDNMMACSQNYELASTFIEFSEVIAFSTLIEGGGHLVEIDKPYEVAEVMLNFYKNQIKRFPAFYGYRQDIIYKGNEKEKIKVLVEKGVVRPHFKPE